MGDDLERRDEADLPFTAAFCCIVRRVCRFSLCGCRIKGTAFVLDDFRLPSSTNEVGPSTTIFLHGGEAGRLEVRCGGPKSVILLFFFGGWPSLLSDALASGPDVVLASIDGLGKPLVAGASSGASLMLLMLSVLSDNVLSRLPFSIWRCVDVPHLQRVTPPITTKTQRNRPNLASEDSLTQGEFAAKV
jgi:hypothetical protein